jgi:hypothetical protein
MPVYCCNFLDDHDRIAAAEDFEANAPSEAIDQARMMLRRRPHHFGIEVWEGGRRLHQELAHRASPAPIAMRS